MFLTVFLCLWVFWSVALSPKFSDSCCRKSDTSTSNLDQAEKLCQEPALHKPCTALQKKVQAPKSGLLPFKLAPATLDQAKGRAQSKEVGNASTSSNSRGQREKKDGADTMGAAKRKEIMLIAMLSNRGDMEDKQRINTLRKEDLNYFRPRLAVTKATTPNCPVTVESIVTFPINVLVNMHPKFKKKKNNKIAPGFGRKRHFGDFFSCTKLDENIVTTLMSPCKI